jgi:anti-anti-sigma factor
MRIPGPHGPILRLNGDLTVTTMEALRRELGMLTSAGHEGLVVNLSGVRSMDADGALAVIEAGRRMGTRRGRFVIVSGRGPAADYLHLVGADRILPVCTTEKEALDAVDGHGEAPPPRTWAQARSATLARWTRILERVGTAGAEELVRDLTGLFALCHKAERDLQIAGPGAAACTRCQFCPLFYQLGGTPAELGCGSALGRLLECAQARDWDGLRRGVEEIIGKIERMPLPEEAAHGAGAAVV